MSTYLVTGGCGFIGSHIVEAVLRSGEESGDKHEVRIIDNLSSGSLDNISGFSDRVNFLKADVREREAIAPFFEGVDYVFHEAALVSVFESVDKPMVSYDINITGTLNVCESCASAGVKRLVMASSAAVYGNDPSLPKVETQLPRPESPYGLAKITKEYIARIYSLLYDLPAVGLRYFNVFGPRQNADSPYSGVISIFVKSILENKPVTIYGDGTQTRDFVFVEDVASANLLAMHSKNIQGGEAFNIGRGEQTSLRRLIEAIDDITDRVTEPVFKQERRGDIKHSVADITRARDVIGFEPRFDVREGLARLIDSIKGV